MLLFDTAHLHAEGRARGICAMWCIVYSIATIANLNVINVYKKLNNSPALASRFIRNLRALKKRDTILSTYRGYISEAKKHEKQMKNIITMLSDSD